MEWFTHKTWGMMHYCGNGFKSKAIKKKVQLKNYAGKVLTSRFVVFCIFCGKERKNANTGRDIRRKR